MQPFKYLDHTSEAEFQAFGKTLDEAFSNAALAVFNLVVDTSTVKSIEKHEIHIASGDNKELLFDFIDKLIFLQDVEGFMLSKVQSLTIINTNLHAILLGDNHKHYDTHGEVKAPTYNSMKIEKTSSGWMIQMVVDV